MYRQFMSLAVGLTALACSEVGPTNPFDPQAPKSVQALGTISGRVANLEDAAPVNGARILLYRSDRLPERVCAPPMGSQILPGPANADGGVNASGERPLAEATSNERGVFQLNDLVQGEYTLCVNHPRFLPLRRGELIVPIGGDIGLGEDLLLTPGKGTVIAQVDLGDLEVESGRGQTVIQGVDVTLTPIGEGLGNSSNGTPDGQGTVTFSRIPLGSWRLRFAHPDYRPVVEDIELETIGQVIEVRGLLPIELEVNPGTVSGVLILEEPSPTSMEGIELTLTDENDVATEVSITLVTDPLQADYGRFTIDGAALRAGFYRLNIVHTGAEYQAKTVAPVQVRAGEGTDLGRIEVSYARGSIRGTIGTADNASTAGATVTLSGLTEAITQTDGTGAYRFDNIRGGTYQLGVTLSGYRPARVEGEVVRQEEETVVDNVVLEVDPGSLTGRVIDESGNPIEGVSAGIEGSVSAETAADGTFTLTGLRTGIYTVAVRKAGYVSSTILNQAVSPGQATDLGTLQLAHARNRLSGVVETADGASPNGAIIRLSEGPTTADAVAGPDGTFTFDNVRVGTYTVTATLDGYRAATAAGIVVSDAQAGDAGTVDLEINPGSFSGSVTDESGRALAGASVSVVGGVVTQTDEDGAFTIAGLRAGDYTLTISADGHDSQVLRNQAIVAGQESALGLIALDISRNDLSGSVTTVDNGSVTGALVTLSEGPTEASVVVDADGAFRFEDIQVGTYTVSVTLSGYQTATTAGLEVSAAQAADAGVINLAVDPGSLTGTVVDEEGLGIIGATIAPVGGANTNSDDDGAFTIGDLRAGEYTLNISAPGFAPEILRNQTVLAGQATDLGAIALRYARNGLSGTVTTADGVSAAGAVATLGSDGLTAGSAVVDADGRFSFEEVRAGEYTVTVTLDGYQAAAAAGVSVSFEQSGDAGIIELSIDPGQISGQVVDENGANVEGVSATLSNGAVTLTDTDGRFSMNDLKAGEYTLTLAGDDLETLVVRNVSVKAGLETVLEKFEMSFMRSTLEGTVATEDGIDPVGAQVKLIGGPSSGNAVVDADGRYTFEEIIVGTYAVTVTLDDYQPGGNDNIVVESEQAGDGGLITLLINPGGLMGKVFDEAGDPLSLATVAILGGDDTVTDGDGSFALNDLRAGSYSLSISKDGYITKAVNNQAVDAGDTTNVGEILLEFERGRLSGTVTLDGDGDPSTARVIATANFDESIIRDGVVRADGTWQIDDLQVGQYTVRADASNYISASDTAEVIADQDTLVNLNLEVDFGCRRGQLQLGDGGTDFEAVDLSVVETGEALNGADEDGAFTIAALPPGEYTIRGTLAGYDDGEVDIRVEPGEGCDDAGAFDLHLRDVTAPDTPALALLYPEWEALPGQDDGSVYIPEGTYSEMADGSIVPDEDGSLHGFTLVLNTDEFNPLSDRNFFHDGTLLGRWRMRFQGAEYTLTSTSFSLDRCFDEAIGDRYGKGCIYHGYHPAHGYLFTFITSQMLANGERAVPFARNILQTLLIQAEDIPIPVKDGAFGNLSEEGLFQFFFDTLRPRPRGGNLLQLRVNGAEADLANDDEGQPFDVYYTQDEVISLEVISPLDDAAYGCTYLYTYELEGGAPDAVQVRPGWADQCLYWNADSAPTEEDDPVCYGDDGLYPAALDTEECYPGGRPQISLTPGPDPTLYCVRGVDLAGQMSNAACAVIIQDQVEPAGFDAYPNDVEVRGPIAVVYLTNAPDNHHPDLNASLDSHFDHFEVRSDAAGAQFMPVDDCVDEGCTQIRVRLEPGRTNTFEFVAVDQAGNRGEAVEVVFHETSNIGIAEPAGAIGTTPSLFGTNIVWAEPRGCEAVGPNGGLFGRGCQFAINYLDRSLPNNVVRSLDFLPRRRLDAVGDNGDYELLGMNGNPTTCVIACGETPEGFSGSKEPILRLAPTGLYATTYLEGSPFPAGPAERPEKTHRLFYQSFGSDGVPNGAVDPEECTIRIEDGDARWSILDVQTNGQVLAYIRYKGHLDEAPFRLYMRRQFDAEGEIDDACEDGKVHPWTYVDLESTPVQMGVIENAVFVVTANNDVQVYTNRDNALPRGFSLSLTNLEELTSAPDNIVPTIVAADFAQNSLNIVVGWEEPDADVPGGNVTTHRLYTFNMASGSQCEACVGDQATEQCFVNNCPGGVHQRVFDLVADDPDGKKMPREGTCDCPEGWGCFSARYTLEPLETVTTATCIQAAWGLGDPTEGDGCADDFDRDGVADNPCVGDEICVERPTSPRGDEWNSYCATPCEADGGCPGGGTCERRTSDQLKELTELDAPGLEYHMCVQVSEGIDFTAFGADECDWCGPIRELSIDGDVMAWTTGSRNGDDFFYGLNAARVPHDYRQQILPRSLVPARVSPIDGLATDGDRVIYLDQSSGTARVRRADVSQQNWTGLSPAELFPKTHLAAGLGGILYASYDSDPNNDRDTDGLYLSPLDGDGAAMSVTLEPAGEDVELVSPSLQREWRSGRALSADGTITSIFARQTRNGLFRPSFYIGRIAPGLQAHPDWTEIPLIQRGTLERNAADPVPDDWDPALTDRAHTIPKEAYQVEVTSAVTHQEALFYNLPTAVLPGPGAENCVDARTGFGVRLRAPDFANGQLSYPADRSRSLNQMELDARGIVNRPSLPLVDTDCAALDATFNPSTGETHIVCAGPPAGCPSQPSDMTNSAARAKQNIHYFRTFMGRVIERVDLTDVIDPAMLEEPDQADDLGCDDGDVNDYSGLDFTRCGALKLVAMGTIVDAVVNADGIVAIEMQDDAVRHIGLLDPGSDGRWGPSEPGKLGPALVNDDVAFLVYSRLGSNLGRLSINQNQLVFADAKKTRQAELFRVSLDDYGIQRITDNGRIQSHPSLNETGLFYVDDRYSSTANGQDIIGAGLTRRQLKTTCDDTYNPCPVGFLCNTVLGIPTCSLESNGPCARIAACPQGTECVEIPAEQCVGSDDSCQACLDYANANQRCALHPLIPNQETGCLDLNGCGNVEREEDESITCIRRDELLAEVFPLMSDEDRETLVSDGCGVCAALP